jgi:transposase
MRDIELYSKLLMLEWPWQVDDIEMDEKGREIHVMVEMEVGAKLPCPECGRADCSVKDRRERAWRHLDTCQFKTLIHASVPRIDCPQCGVKTVQPPWAGKHARFTLLFERLAIAALQQMSIKGTCQMLRITWDEADAIMRRAVEFGLKRRDRSNPRRIGIDEKSAGKGHDYVTIVHDLDTSKVVWVGEEREEATLDQFFEWLGAEGCRRIECIAMDMWAPYRASCRRWIDEADNKTVLDRFHLDKHLNEAVNEVRKAEHRALQEQNIDLLKGTRYDWLYRPENRPAKSEARFRQLRHYDLQTVRAYAIKENFRHFWSYVYEANARKFFQEWHFWATHSRLRPIIKAAKRMKNHFERIITYFRHRATNSIAEGINNKIEAAKRKAYGFRNRKRFINAIYFHCAGLQLCPP